MNQPLGQFDLVSEDGVGRPFVLLFEETIDAEFARATAAGIAQKSRCLVLRSPKITDQNWRELGSALRTFLHAKGIRQASFVGFGAAGTLVQNLCLLEPKTVRTAVLFRAASRAHPSVVGRIVDRLESSLPLGLPLRLAVGGFDSRPFLQRIRCPVLIVVPPGASVDERRDAEMMAKRMPTAWEIVLGAENVVDEFTQRVLEFTDVPAKAPQKNTAA